MFRGSALQNLDLCVESPWFLFAFADFSVYTRICLALFREAAFLTVFQHFLLTDSSPKSCLGATSVSNKFFEHGVKMSLGIGCRYTTHWALVVPGKHWRTSSRKRVLLPVLWIHDRTRTNPCLPAVVRTALAGIIWFLTLRLPISTFLATFLAPARELGFFGSIHHFCSFFIG